MTEKTEMSDRRAAAYLLVETDPKHLGARLVDGSDVPGGDNDRQNMEPCGSAGADQNEGMHEGISFRACFGRYYKTSPQQA